MSLLERSGVGWSVPVPVVPINFLSVPFHLLIYITIYILSSYRVSIKGYCPMKIYLEQLEQLEQLERLPENHFCFDPVTGTPEVPISSRKPHSVLSLFTLAIIKSSFAVLCHLLIVVPTFLFWTFQVTYALQS